MRARVCVLPPPPFVPTRRAMLLTVVECVPSVRTCLHLEHVEAVGAWDRLRDRSVSLRAHKDFSDSALVALLKRGRELRNDVSHMSKGVRVCDV